MFDRLLKMGEIGRRYFVLNSFDGVLTVLGIVMGSFVSGVENPFIVFTAGLGASIALGISGFSSAYLTEKAERRQDVLKIEEQMLEKVDGVWRDEKINKLPFKISLVNGLSPFVWGIFCLMPFILSILRIVNMKFSYYFSIVLSLVALMFLGFFLGKVSKRDKIITSFKMLVVGFITMLILYLLRFFGLGQ
ncbi:MAG: VIT1/CCC1 transporter family protein [Candidatus Aenigmatarchaeota archaeon]